jgi:hypothetical protein
MNGQKSTDKSDLLAAYSRKWRFLEEFELHDDHASASFIIHNVPYSDAGAVNHPTAVELQSCLNQMLYCYFLSNGVFEQFSGISRYQGESLFRWQADHTFVIEESFRFKRRISVQERIPAILRQLKSRTIGNTHMACLKFEFGRDACFGMVKIAITRDDVPNNAMHTDGNSAALHSRR